MSVKSIALKVLLTAHHTAGFLPAIGNFRPLRGSFSAYEAVKSGQLEGEILAASQPVGECLPGSMSELAGFQQHDHQPWPVFWAKTHEARLVGRMLHWRDTKDQICIEGVFYHAKRRRLSEDSYFAQTIVAPSQPLAGAWTNILSNWNEGGNYFHWLLDGLTRLAVREKLPEKTKFFIPRNAPGYVAETIALLGLEDVAIPIPFPSIQPEIYYFCSPTSMTGVWNPLGYEWLKRNFSKYFVPLRSGLPIFLTRRGASRLPENLPEMERLFSDAGFRIVDCGSISVREQIAAISGASSIAGLHGAAMTNLLWASAGTPVIEIFEPDYMNGCYEQIANHGELSYRYVLNGGDVTIRILKDWISESATNNRNLTA